LDEGLESGVNYIMRSLMICTPHPILFGWSNLEWAGHVERIGERKSVDRVLVGKPEGINYFEG
jgi:hypothetical protein